MSLKQFLDQTGLQELITKFTDWCKQSFLGKNDKASNASKLDVADTGNIYKPVFFNNGVPVACEHKLESDVPANAKFTDTVNTYVAGAGISINGNTINNAGVRSIGTGSVNGTISVNSNGTTLNVAVKGLGSAAYTNSNEYAKANHNHSIDTALSDTSNNPVQNKAIKSYVDNRIQEAKNYADNNSCNITTDTAMSDSSTYPVQNKVIKNYIDEWLTNGEKDINIYKLDANLYVNAKWGFFSQILRVPVLDSTAGMPLYAGNIYLDSNTKDLKCFDGSVWKALSTVKIDKSYFNNGNAVIQTENGQSSATYEGYIFNFSDEFAILEIPARVFEHSTSNIVQIEYTLPTSMINGFAGNRVVSGFGGVAGMFFPVSYQGRNNNIAISHVQGNKIIISTDLKNKSEYPHGVFYAPIPAISVLFYNV